MRLLGNLYFLVLFVPLVIFLILVWLGVMSDPINLWSRLYVFGAFGYAGARYVGRAPLLALQDDRSSEARNIVGWAVIILALMAQQVYSWVYVSQGRPDFLTQSYWSPALVVLTGVGVTLVASSVPRFPPFGSGPQGLSVMGSFLVGLLSAISFFVASHMGQIMTAIKAILANGSHAL